MDQAAVLGEIDFAHAPFTNLLENPVMANGLTDHAIPLTQCSCAQCYDVRGLKATGKARS